MPNLISGIQLDELYKKLESGEKGLSPDTAAAHLLAHSKNARQRSTFEKNLRLFISQFTSPLVLLLVVAVILSAFLGQTADTLIILFILLATGILGFWQEWNAGKAVEQLQKIIQLKCDVIRDGKEQEISAGEIARGDMLVLHAGDIIPADCRLVETNELHVNESSITGESFPVEKIPGAVPDEKPLPDKINCVWQGTSVVSGTAKALVVNTGGDTIFGQMSHSLSRSEESAFEKGIKHFGYFLMQITIVLSLLNLCANLYFKKPLFDSVLFALAIAVGMAPELLPAIMSFAMSVGAKRMLKKKVIVKKLSSIFNFGEVNVLCTDKTGTLTEGIIKIKDIVDPDGKPNERVRQFAFLNAYFQNGFKNPIDEALKQIGEKTDGYTKFDEIPYDFNRKRLSIAVSYGDKKFLVSKGAVPNILEICSNVFTENNTTALINKQQLVDHQYSEYCSNGIRAIGIAYKEVSGTHVSKDDEKEMTFLGFALLEDPLKEGIVDTLNHLRSLNVSVKIITGDNKYVAAYVAKKIGIAEPKILTGGEINSILPEALKVRAAQTDVFAEVEPQQKESIIKALQKSKMVVAYMGDGINDVAAIHAADTGISVDDAVDVAKEAADFVLLEKDLSVLADGIYEGRKTFSNSLKYIFINTGSTFGNMFSMAGASIILPFLPMLPKQILLTNFLTDIPFMTVASDNVDEERLVAPGRWNMSFIRNFMIVFGIHSSLFDFATFYFQLYVMHLDASTFQTGWFIESCLTQLLILFVIRTRKPFLKSKPGKWLSIISLVSCAIVVLLPILPFAKAFGFSIAGLYQIGAIAAITIAYVLTADLLKIIFFKYQKE